MRPPRRPEDDRRNDRGANLSRDSGPSRDARPSRDDRPSHDDRPARDQAAGDRPRGARPPQGRDRSYQGDRDGRIQGGKPRNDRYRAARDHAHEPRPRAGFREPTPSRAIAAELLMDVLDDGRPLDDAVATHPGFHRLEPRDRAHARMLVATVLRRKGEFDRLLGRVMQRPAPEKAMHVLRLGLADLRVLSTPDHAAVDNAVRLAQAGGLGGLSGLVNAVLRRLAAEGDQIAAAAKIDPKRENLPRWLRASWEAAYGVEATDAIAEVLLREPPIDLSVRNPREAAAWAEKLGGRAVGGRTVRLDRAEGGVDRLEGYDEGAWWVQDLAATLPAMLLGDVKGKLIYDLCAAPGGKTAQLAAAGAHVTAVDRSARRMMRLGENMARLGFTDVTPVTADLLEWRPEGAADAVLLDAPCSGTGTLRRRPDLAWSKRPDQVAELAELQEKLLEAALKLVKPGGLVVYATCSLEPSEGEDLVRRVLDRGLDADRVPIGADELPARLGVAINAAGELRTTPALLADAGGMDGFFAVRLRRRDAA
ncbi:transcription antitermination factor NusB [Tistrella mobilis]